jgi:hypothetical protein
MVAAAGAAVAALNATIRADQAPEGLWVNVAATLPAAPCTRYSAMLPLTVVTLVKPEPTATVPAPSA